MNLRVRLPYNSIKKKKIKQPSIKRGDCQDKVVGASIILFTVAGYQLVWTSWNLQPTGKAQTCKTVFFTPGTLTKLVVDALFYV